MEIQTAISKRNDCCHPQILEKGFNLTTETNDLCTMLEKEVYQLLALGAAREKTEAACRLLRTAGVTYFEELAEAVSFL